MSPGGPERSGGGAQRLDQATTSATSRDHVRAIALGAIETPRFSMIVSTDWDGDVSFDRDPPPQLGLCKDKGDACAEFQNVQLHVFAR